MSDLAKEGVASRRIANEIRTAIVSGAMAPGTRIYQEEIAEQFGASRLPVREALRILESEGLILLKSNSGAWVAKLDMAECVEIYKIRERLEPLALRESIPRLTESEVGAIERLCDETEKSLHLDDFLGLDRQFHLLTYQRCEMDVLRAMVERFWNTTQHHRRAYRNALAIDENCAIHEHRLIVDAIKRRDPDDGERILLTHIRRARLALERRSDLFDN